MIPNVVGEDNRGEHQPICFKRECDRQNKASVPQELPVLSLNSHTANSGRIKAQYGGKSEVSSESNVVSLAGGSAGRAVAGSTALI